MPGTIGILQKYDSVLVWSWEPWLDSETVGNVLADYFDWGGRVVTAVGSYAIFDASVGYKYNIEGRWISGKYNFFKPDNYTWDKASGILAVEPRSCLLEGAHTITADKAFRQYGPAINGVQARAHHFDLCSR